MEQQAAPNGRATAILVTAGLTMGSAVMPIVCLASMNTQNELSFAVVYMWEICLFALTLCSIVTFGYLVFSGKDHHVVRCRSRGSNLIFLLPTILIGLATGACQIFYSVRELQCITRSLGVFFYLTKFLSMLFTGFFSVLQTVFLTLFYRYKCVSAFARLLVGVTISGTMYLCVADVLDVFRTQTAQQDMVYHYKGHLRNMHELNSTNYFNKLLVFSTCNGTTEMTDSLIVQVFKYSYSFPSEYSLLALCFLLPMWNVQSVSRHYLKSDDSRTQLSFRETSSLLGHTNNYDKRQKCVCINVAFAVASKLLSFLSRRSLIVSGTYVLLHFCFNLFVEIKSSFQTIEDNLSCTTDICDYEIASYYVQTIWTYILCIVPFFGYLMIRKDNPSRWSFDIWNSFLLFSACGHLLLGIFSTIDSISVLHFYHKKHIAEKILYFVKILLHFVGIYCQTLFILKVKNLVAKSSVPSRQYTYAKGVTIFLFLANAEHFLSDSFLTAPTMAYLQDMQGNDTFGQHTWWLITKLVFPFVIFYRLYGALMCVKVYRKMKSWKDI